MTKALYIHGFGGKFNENDNKIKSLKKAGYEVVGIDVDYTFPYEQIEPMLVEVALFHDVDVVIGISLGGFYAAAVGNALSVPFVAINPAINPRISLSGVVGDGMTFDGRAYHLTGEVVDAYPYEFCKTGCGLILLDEGDNYFTSTETRTLLSKHYEVVMFEGGCHQFSHMRQSIPHIDKLVLNADIVYGLGM